MLRIPAGLFLSLAPLALFLFSSCATMEGFPSLALESKDSSASGSQTTAGSLAATRAYVKEVKTHTANDKTDVKIIADKPIKFFAYRLENPDRLAVEMENMGHKLAQPQIIVNDRLVEKVTVVNFERVKKTRAEIWIKVPYAYNIEKEAASVTATIKEDPTSDTAALRRAKKVIDDLSVEVIRLKEKLEAMERREEELFAKTSHQEEAPKESQPPAQPEFEPVKTEEPPAPAATIASASTSASEPAPAPAPDVTISADQERAKKTNEDITGVKETVFGWRDAWEAKDLNRYQNAYSQSFPGNASARAAWLTDKRKRFERAGGIKVEIIDLEMKVSESKASVKFTQRYTSGRHSDVGVKTLILVKYGDEWKIDSEDWRPGR